MNPQPSPAAILAFQKRQVYESLQPRIQVKIDGLPYVALSYSTDTNAHGATDTASFTVPIQGYPDWTVQIQRGDDTGNANQPVYVEILLSIDGGRSFSRRFYGVVDQYTSDLSADTTTFSCRSLAAPLTSTKITTPFSDGAGVTTVDFIEGQATRFGLDFSLNLPASQEPGKMIDVLGSEFVTGVRNWNIWDLMLQCAQYDDVDIWVDKLGTLHYEAASFIDRPQISYIWGENVLNVEGTHSPQFSKNIRVEVRSYKPRTKQTTTSRVESLLGGGIQVTTSSRTVTSNPIFGTTLVQSKSISKDGTVTVSVSNVSGGAASSGATQFAGESGQEKYIFYVANKTPQQCADMAQRIWRQVSMHEFALVITAPITRAQLEVMGVTAKVILFGAPFARYADEYWPRAIDEVVDPTQGAFWRVRAVNHALPQGAV